MTLKIIEEQPVVSGTIEITEMGVQGIRRFLKDNGADEDSPLRLGVKGGGCSGLSYDLKFTPTEKGDTVLDFEGFNVFMDAKSMIYLKNMQLDYNDGLQGKGFVFSNPNATSTCGCGESFSIA